MTEPKPALPQFELSPEDELRLEDDLRRQARELALKRLAMREHTAQEIETHLIKHRLPPEIIADTLVSLTRENLLNERRYASELIRSRAMREKSPDYILQRLQQKGVRIELDEVRALIGETSGRSEVETARQLVERKYPRAQRDEKELRRAYSALLRGGFSSDVAREALGGRVPREAESGAD